MLILILITGSLVVAHVYYAYYFSNKIAVNVKKKLTHKLFTLQNPQNRKETLTILTHNSRTFSYLSIFVPNQVYYAILDTIMTFIAVKEAGDKSKQYALI